MLGEKKPTKFRTHTLTLKERKKSIETCSYRFYFFRYAFREREITAEYECERVFECVCACAYVRMWMKKRTEKREAAFKFVQPPLFRALLHDKTNTNAYSRTNTCMYTHIVHPIWMRRAGESTRHIEFLHWIQTSESLSIIIIIVISPIDFFVLRFSLPFNRCNFNELYSKFIAIQLWWLKKRGGKNGAYVEKQQKIVVFSSYFNEMPSTAK